MLAVTILSTAVLGGCQRTTYGSMDTRPQQPAPLMPAPIGGVESNQLPPASGAATEFPQAPETATAPANTEMAAANAPAVTKESLIGRWSVDSGGGRCDVFLALTKWTGGYRAASRGCVGDAASVSAWDVQGKQVILSDSSGNKVAGLYQTANERYDGSTSAGQPISLSR
ncbi:protease inhibitor Inh/omp19 family protein [Hoeflea marina]|nr:protease inhibitor Inh/omp19 family protein [Hoeflea marina]